ncbi:ABC transporter ATP-binding protein [Xanthobacter sp. KR7-65]|uniref:ABC transporter ATP-binding protein n=1 Tax=Xanthobacter sp. KR7-65 TaxID=3156612 RepID=UPI0032B31497
MAFIQLRDVTKTFVSPRNGRLSVAVNRFNLDIERGEFFCLLGPSGCGKTTVLGMMAGFESATSGEILLDGKPVRGPARDRGVVFQGDDSLYPWLNAQENIEFGLRMCGVPKAERHERARAALRLVGLNGQNDKYPAELSGGMKQRIQIARALVNEPKMLLMDEPFGALDAQTRYIMQRELRKIWLATQSTVLFITHDVDEAILLGTRVGVMSAGPGGTLREVVDIDLKGERDRTDPQYSKYFNVVYNIIRDEVAKAAQGVAA